MMKLGVYGLCASALGAVVSGCADAPAPRVVDKNVADTSVVAPLIEFRIAQEQPGDGVLEHVFEGRTLYLNPEPVILEADFRAVRPEVGTRRLLVDFELKPEAAARLKRTTAANIGSRIAVLLESRVLSAPVIISALGARGVVSGELPPAEVERLALRIRNRWPERD